ncbi:MAG: PepSY-associated TM helix domain-containing protein, partial [Alphaproteobacteria bacterium]
SFTIARGARGYRLHRDLHGAVGIWGLAVFAVVTAAGVYLSFPESIRGAVDLLLPARDLRAAASAARVEPIPGSEPLAIDAAVALARERVPDTEPRLGLPPARPDQPVRVALRRDGDDRHGPAVTVLVDQWARRVIEVFDPRDFTAGETILAWQHALHAGEGLGPVWKMLVFLSGLLPLLFTITGILMWLLRRRRRKMPAAGSDSLGDPVYTARRAGG